MYRPEPTIEHDLATIHALLRAHALATWVTNGPEGLTADHVPFMLDASRGAHGVLRGHVARANTVWRRVAAQPPETQSLLVFQGPSGYITPSWYASKREHGRVVPTWNYATVHVHGVARALDDKAATLAIVRDLTLVHEASRKEPWTVEDAPSEYIDKLLEAIVGIEVTITAIEAKWKVNQHRPIADQQGMVAGLRERALPMDAGLADLSHRFLNKSTP